MTLALFPRLAAALAASDITEKLTLTQALAADWQAGKLDWQDTTPVELVCGRPAKPELVPPKQVTQRSTHTAEGRAGLLHAITHIEFTAINLALDHAARFRGLPEAYYGDWIGVAAEEAEHFMLLRQRLQGLGHDYGDFPAHGGLWAMAERTADDPLDPHGADSPPARSRVVSMPRRRSSADWKQPATRPAPACSTSSCATRSATSAWATAGSASLCDNAARAGKHLSRPARPASKPPRPQAPMNEVARLAAGFTPAELAALAKKM
jgi:uncharacterized ferritin-like protein (DUF455 family)